MNQSLSEEELGKVVGHLPRAVYDLLPMYSSLMVGGGFIRAVLGNEPVKDIDIFTTDLSVVDAATYALTILATQTGHTAAKFTHTPNTITVHIPDMHPIQFVNNASYESPEKCIEKFDFTCCQAVVWYADGRWQSLCSPSFTQDVAAKRLVYTSPVREEAPGGSLWRAFKYAQKGYSITQVELSRLVARCVNGQAKIKHDECNPLVKDELPEVYPDQILRSFSFRRKGGNGGAY